MNMDAKTSPSQQSPLQSEKPQRKPPENIYIQPVLSMYVLISSVFPHSIRGVGSPGAKYRAVGAQLRLHVVAWGEVSMDRVQKVLQCHAYNHGDTLHK